MLTLFANVPYIWTCVVALTAVNHVAAQYPPDKNTMIIKELEHLYLDKADSGMINGVQPCTQYIDPTTGKPNNNLGRQQAASWIRTTFHDFVTANIYTESGGIDASIGFETTRAENVGPAFDDSLTFFSYFFSKEVSMSDLIALGTVLAVGACGGPHIELRGGRVDATAAGPTGVPEPETDLQDTLTDFANAGFNQDDTITLTACGHSMGGVHKSSFPQVVGNATGLTGSDGRQPFDGTVATFDINVVNDYVHSTGLKGGPLVTTPNKTVQSDLRLYASDQNQTVNRLSAQGSTYFESQCQAVFQRMIETVPGSVQLTLAIDPTPTNNLRPADIYLNVDWKGTMTMTGFFRYIQVAGSPSPPHSLPITLISRAGKTTTTTTTATASSADTGTGIWGPTKSYPFTLTFPATIGVSALSVNTQTFPFQDTMFVNVGQSNVVPNPPTFITTPAANTVTAFKVNTTVAYLSTSPPSTLAATYSIPVPQSGTVSPAIDTSTTTTLKLIGKTGPYSVYSALVQKSLSAKQIYGTSVDVSAGGAVGVLGFKPFVAQE